LHTDMSKTDRWLFIHSETGVPTTHKQDGNRVEEGNVVGILHTLFQLPSRLTTSPASSRVVPTTVCIHCILNCVSAYIESSVPLLPLAVHRVQQWQSGLDMGIASCGQKKNNGVAMADTRFTPRGSLAKSHADT
jgi:hypothetical protein